MRTVQLALPFAVALVLLGCSSKSSTVVGTAATASPAHSTSAPSAAGSTATSATASVSGASASGASASGAAWTATPTPSAAASGTATAQPAAKVYFAESGEVNGTVVYEPSCQSGCELSGDGTTGLWNMTWPTWTATEAVGTGTEKLDDCNPNCAAGKLYAVAVKVTFSKAVKAACGAGAARLYWTSVSFTWPNGLPSVFKGQNAPSNPFTYPEISGTAACS